MFEVAPFADLALGLVTGIGFGFLLHKGGVTRYQTILGQLLLKDWTTFKIMITAIATGAIGVYAMVDAGQTFLDLWPFQPAAMLIGAVLFGIGLAVIGYCPGTGMAAAGTGSRDAVVGVLGMICGAGVLVVAYDALEPVALAFGDFGKITLADVLGVSPWWIVGALVLVVPAVLWLIELREPRLHAGHAVGKT